MYNFHSFKLYLSLSPQDLTGIDLNLLADVMTVSVNVTRGEVIRKHLNKQKAEAARDALSKALYDRVFRWIVNRINQLLAPTAEEMIGESEIGILDIFGFEKFEHNSFEQLCINLANEQLQFFFNEVCVYVYVCSEKKCEYTLKHSTMHLYIQVYFLDLSAYLYS